MADPPLHDHPDGERDGLRRVLVDGAPVLTVARAGELFALDATLAELLAAGRDRVHDAVDRALSGDRLSRASTLLAPVDEQEVWASGVTYRRSATARVQESVAADVYERILREDVVAATTGPEPPVPAPAAAPRRAPPGSGEVVPLRGVRRSIAHTLTRAWQEIPHIIDYREVDATKLVHVRQLLKQRALDRHDESLAQALTPTPIIAKAAARALADHPYVNASIDLEREEITLHAEVHLGIATATPDGLMVPVVHDADRKSIAELALEVAELSRAARERRLAPDQLSGGTFTVNNYGGLGIWLGTPIIRPPEVANLGVGAVRDRVVAIDGEPRVRPILALAVSGDHRVLDGDTLAAFVTQVVELLEEPLLLLEGLR